MTAPDAKAVPRGATFSGWLPRNVAVLLTVQFLAGVVSSPVLAFLPVFVEERLLLGQDFTANARTIWLGGMVVFGILGGALSDAVGRKATVVAGLSGSLAGAAIFVSDSPLLVGFVLPGLLGLAEGLFVTAGQSYLMEVSPRNRLSLMTALYFSGFTVGNMVGGLAGGAVAEWRGFEALALSIAAATVAIVVGAIAFLPTIESSGARSRASLGRAVSGYAGLVRQRPIQLLMLTQLLRTVFWGAFQVMGPVMIDHLTGSKFTIGAFVGAITGVGLVSMLLIGRYSDRRGRRGPVLVTLAGTSVGAFMIGVASDNVAGLFVAGTLAGAFAWGLSGQMTPLAKELAGEGESGKSIGLVTAMWGIAAIAGAQLGGRMVETNATGALYICGGLSLIALLSALGLFRTIGAPNPKTETAR